MHMGGEIVKVVLMFEEGALKRTGEERETCLGNIDFLCCGICSLRVASEKNSILTRYMIVI